MTRQDAIDILVGVIATNSEEENEALDIAIEALEQEPKCGKWIVYPLMDEGRVKLECPRCGDTFIRAVAYKPHFCENCGARMESDEE